MSIVVKADKTIAAFARLDNPRAVEQALRKAGLLVERNMKQKLTVSGRHKKGTPTPSVPGTPPAIVTGALRRSVTTSPVQKGFRGFEVSIGPTMVYARVQELGGGPRNLPARPYVQPTMTESMAAVRSLLISELSGMVSRAGG